MTLKERRRLVLMVREAPLHAGHIRNMLALTEMGGVVHPPVPAFYTHPASVADIVDHCVARALDAFGIDVPDLKRWGEPGHDAPRPRTRMGRGDEVRIGTPREAAGALPPRPLALDEVWDGSPHGAS